MAVCEKLRELANRRRRFGYRRLHSLLCRVDDYNRERPHSSLAYATPAAFAAELDKQWPACAFMRNEAAGL